MSDEIGIDVPVIFIEEVIQAPDPEIQVSSGNVVPNIDHPRGRKKNIQRWKEVKEKNARLGYFCTKYSSLAETKIFLLTSMRFATYLHY